MINMSCVAKAIECCKKYEYLQTLVVIDNENDFDNMLNYLRKVNENVLIFSKRDMVINSLFCNGSRLLVRSKNNTARGIIANLLLYDDKIDENVLNTVFRPMIRPYSLDPLGYN